MLSAVDMKLEAIDINEDTAQSSGTAYYRLPEDVKDFIVKCYEKYGILGFEWDAESPFNFGIILRKDKEVVQ
jgi:hypothetical protein